MEEAAPEAVHRARTTSRRLQASLEAMLREAGSGSAALKEPTRTWLRSLKRIRRAAGPVRDLDVHRKLLESWLGEHAAGDGPSKDGPGKDEPGKDGPSKLEAQAAELDDWLRKQRAHLAPRMRKKIAKQGQGLQELRSSFEAARGQVPLTNRKKPRPAEAVALEDFVRATDTMPRLEAQNLHDFRKAIKKARYLAESGAEDPKRSSVGKKLKHIQDSIGEWHDWLCLLHEASAVLGDHASELTSTLECELENHFAGALKTTETARGQLLREWIKHRGGKRAEPATALFVKASRAASGF